MLLFVVGVVIASFKLLPSTKGWSKDVAVTNEMSKEIFSRTPMAMLIQFKTDPAPPMAGPITLMANVKDRVGFTAAVNEVLFTYSQASQGFTQTKEGVPIGEFGTRGNGFYTARVELPFPGDWQVQIQVNHIGSKFNATFPLTVKGSSDRGEGP